MASIETEVSPRTASPPKLARSFALGTGGGLAILTTVLAAIALASGVDAVTAEYSSADWTFAPIIVGLTLLNFSLRALRWHLTCNKLAVTAGTLSTNGLTYLAGGAFVLTPWRAGGEVVRSYYAKKYLGVEVSRSMPLLLLERGIDLMVMVLLVAAGATVVSDWSVALGGALGLILLGVGGSLAGGRLLLRRLTRSPSFLGARFAPVWAASRALDSLFSPANLLLMFSLGLAAWLVECLTVVAIAVAFEVSISANLGAVVALAHPAATLAGSISFLPGGVGASELSGLGLYAMVSDLPASKVVAIVITTRLLLVASSLVIGLVANLYLMRMGYRRPESPVAGGVI